MLRASGGSTKNNPFAARSEVRTLPRFAILEHDWPERHWDLFLEAAGVLKTWRLLAEPGPGLTVPAEPAADHRLLYLDYEGEVSGGRGTVKRWDAGTFTGEPVGDEWVIAIHGSRVNGTIRFAASAVA